MPRNHIRDLVRRQVREVLKPPVISEVEMDAVRQFVDSRVSEDRRVNYIDAAKLMLQQIKRRISLGDSTAERHQKTLALLLKLLDEAMLQHVADTRELGEERANIIHRLMQEALVHELSQKKLDNELTIRLRCLSTVYKGLHEVIPKGHRFLGVEAGSDVILEALMSSNNLAMATFFSTQIASATRAAIDAPNPAGHFTPWHYAMFSVVAGLAVVQWAYAVKSTLQMPTVNSQAATGLAIETGVAATLATTVFGGFASSTLAAAGPIGFLAINSFLTAKSFYDSMRNFYYASQLKSNGYGDTPAYKMYRQRAFDHLKASALFLLSTAAVGLVVTFASPAILPITIATAAVFAVVKLVQAAPSIKKAAVWAWGKLRGLVSGAATHAAPQHAPKAEDKPKYSTSVAPIYMKGAEVTAEAAKRLLSKDTVLSWKQQRKSAMQESGLATFDQRMHYRNDLLMPLLNEYKASPKRALQEMRFALQAVLRQAHDDYKYKHDHAGLFTNSGKFERKLGLAAELYNLVGDATKPISVQGVQHIVKRYLGGVLKVGALSSMNKRVGHMQDVVEAVEYYAALSQHGAKPERVDMSALRYQNHSGYSVTHYRPTA